MSVGSEIIDNDHKNLLNLIAEYEKTIQLKSIKRLNIVFRELEHYAEEHFKRRPAIQSLCRWFEKINCCFAAFSR
ncbi:hypothetical protein [Terasakiella sp. A23]|uniref:hypothetical protein n=1 Tax=Terasakiella sp. FCG-A23 TaxID=3080561 RepID=UPI0029532CD1|nr:hypothetical protein [Terasakiella sp. A23]